VVEEFNVLYSMLLTEKNPFNEFHNCHLSGLRRYNYLRKTLSNPLAESLNILTNNYFNYGNILEVFAKVGGLPILDVSPKIYIPNSVEKKLESLHFSKKTIVVHCHSNYSPKDWQVYYWEKLVLDLLNEFEYDVVEIGLKSTLNIYHSGYYNFCGKLSLLETAEIIKRAGYFIGIDSGPAHFANAVGTFGFLLFGKLGEFETYMPYSGDYENKSNAKFILKEGQPCSELEYDEVWNVISETIHSKDLVIRD
jgi:heptosyltransferase-3